MSTTTTGPIPPLLIPKDLQQFSVSRSDFLAQHPPYTFLAVGALVFHNDKLLLIQRSSTDSFPGCWETPGGGCDLADETVLHAVARELWEESGLRASQIVRQVGGLVAFEGTMVKASFEVAVRETEGTGEKVREEEVPVKLDPKEHQTYLWVTEKQLLERRAGKGDGMALVFISSDQHNTLLEGFRQRREEGRVIA